MSKNFKSTYLEGRGNLLLKYLDEQEKGLRWVVVVSADGLGIVGYGALLYKSGYPNFSEKNIPEISDINVIPSARGEGAGTAMLKYLEAVAKKKGYREIGLGVGLYADYGAAQMLYVKNDYVPDGKGLFYNNRPVRPGDRVIVDDDLVLFLKKEL